MAGAARSAYAPEERRPSPRACSWGFDDERGGMPYPTKGEGRDGKCLIG